MHSFQIQGARADLTVAGFHVVEAISQLFEAEIVVTCPDDQLDFARLVGRTAALRFQVGEAPRYLHGIVAAFEQDDSGKHHTAYTVTLVPLVWRLLHRRTSRIFQQLSTPDILRKVLGDAGVPADRVALHLTRSYKPRDYCVQYRESDLAFLSRLMEEEGIFYFFEHAESGHTLIVGDSLSAHRPVAGDRAVPFRPVSGALRGQECVSRFRYSERIRPGRASLRDYGFEQPRSTMAGSAQHGADSDLEIYDYPGEHDHPADADPLARIRLEELQIARRTGGGESSVPRLAPGELFTLDDHPRDAFNREYLVTRVEHRGSEPSAEGAEVAGAAATTYANRFEVIPSDVPFRPERATPRPTIKGIQTAVVVGPPGEEIHTDEHGRIKVQFHWDREGRGDDRSSCWLRVSQVWSGPAWGALHVPRVGHEVVIDFLEGDPDRPLVVGSVYNAANVPPYPLPAEKTRSTLKSSSSPGGGGFNELRFEDKKGHEEIYLHGQKDLAIEILHDKRQRVGHDEALRVGHDREKMVGNDQSEKIGGNKTILVEKNHLETIAMTETVTVGMASTLTVGLARTVSVGLSHTTMTGIDHTLVVGVNHSETVAGDSEVSVGGMLSVEVGGASSEAVGGASAEEVAGIKSTSVGGEYSIDVGADMTVTVAGVSKEDASEKTFVVAEKLSIQCGSATITVDQSGTVQIQGVDLTIQGQGTVTVQGASLDVKADGAVNVQASGNVKVQGGNVAIN